MWEKESRYARLILQLYQSIDFIHVHNKLYSGTYPFIMDIDLTVVKRVIIIYGGQGLINHHDRYGDCGSPPGGKDG